MHQRLVVVVEGTVIDGVNPGDTIDNTASVTYSSRDGVDANERGAGDSLEGAGGLNDYEVEDAAATLTVVGELDVSKAADVTTATIGDVVTYTLTVTLGEGTTPNVSIDDTLPAGMVYLNDASIASADAD